jgi:3-phenylpropionate/trans-cinnamate dioxygenase ferredoxin subunit
MPEFVSVATTEELKPGDRIIVEVDDHNIAIFNVGGNYYAIEDLCTHDDGPLAEGELQDTIIECPRHGGQFDLTTGKAVRFPAVTPVPRYEVRVENGEVQILI